METPRRPGQRPARLPPQPQPHSQPQYSQPLSPANETSSGSTSSSHRRQHSPYHIHHLHQPPPFYPSYHYPYPLYYMLPPPPPPPLYPLPPLHHPFPPRSGASRSRDPIQRYRERDTRTFSSSSSRPTQPTHRDHHNTIESPSIRLHDVLKAQSQSLVWLLSQLPKQAQIRCSDVHSSPVKSLGQSLLSQPATDPPVHSMRIVSNDFAWEIPIEVRPPSCITIETVLFALYAALHQPVTPAEWNAIEEPHVRKNAHWVRCSRLAKGDSHLTFNEEMSSIRRVDLLRDRIVYKGLSSLSSSGNGIEFLLRLGSTQANDKRTRMRRGSF